MMTSDEKGRALESAVHAIEAVILESSPALREKPFTIETRKLIEVDGVRHEIDIMVTVELAQGYTTSFIFECKNWKDAVGKNELIVFSEKIKAVTAQRGFFVAKSFTKDATAQAQKDQRITLLTATEHTPATTITPESFHITAPASAKCSTTFRVRASSGTNFYPMDIQGKKVRLYGQEVLLTEYLDGWMREVYAEHLPGFQTAHLAEGVHVMTASAERRFGARECIIDEQEMERMRMDVEFGVQIFRPAVISHYEVSTRGRVIRLEKVKVHNLVIDTTFVTIHRD